MQCVAVRGSVDRVRIGCGSDQWLQSSRVRVYESDESDESICVGTCTKILALTRGLDAWVDSWVT